MAQPDRHKEIKYPLLTPFQPCAKQATGKANLTVLRPVPLANYLCRCS